MIDGIPVFIRALRVFDELPDISELVIAAPAALTDTYTSTINENGIKKPFKVVAGGDSRTASVINAFRACNTDTRYIAVADGARPFTNPEFVENCIKDASVFGASVLGTPIKDTLKVVDDEFITDTPDRRRLFAVQTPQIFRRDLFVRGVQFAVDHDLDFTDDAAMVEAVGVKVHITMSDYRNIKITTPEDLIFAEAIAKIS
jgi:2-C-methyl-D-erythritol 4-phosphate cytidylyltransferase